MHEGAIAAALIQSALELREEENFSSIKTLTVLIGRLHHVVPEVLQNHFRILKKEHPPLSRSRLVIEIAPLRITCRACGQETPIERPTFACSSCQATDIEITSGREMHLKEIEGTKTNKRQCRGGSRTALTKRK
ncbi:MAG TPA: hydrogenase maturation nickel metallochaperone HypA [Patescibacteria group bacterium]|nr:hydrogenase maturation nickel metallochaperone HypA [Patescibacteria group bacterium]